MLVLNRKANETIVIDGNVKITVLRLGRGQVTIGVDAPRHIGIYREELLCAVRHNVMREKVGAMQQ